MPPLALPPPTTQLKATNLQRSGNGLSKEEAFALKQMKDLNTFMKTIRKDIEAVKAKGGTPTDLENTFELKWQELNRLGEEYPKATASFRADQPTFYPVTGPMTKKDWETFQAKCSLFKARKSE